MSYSTYLFNMQKMSDSNYSPVLKFESNYNLIKLMYSASCLVFDNYYNEFKPYYDGLFIIKTEIIITEPLSEKKLFILKFDDKISAQEFIMDIDEISKSTNQQINKSANQ